MDFEKLKTTAGKFGVKVGFTNKGLYANLAKIIPEDEIIIYILQGLDKNSANSIPVIITEKTVYLIAYAGMLFGVNTAAIPISKITSVSTEKSGFGGLLQNLLIAEGTVVHTITNIGAPSAQQAIAAINQAQSHVTVQATVTAAPASQADELAKFKKLLDDGVLTQDEFDRKKAQILGL
jgi:uncharacterized membrane protein YsdA (DUF1294 family)